jgi:hypothetical protein
VGTQASAFIIHLALVFLLIYLLSVWNNICGLFATMVCMRLCSMFYMCLVEHDACSTMYYFVPL